jgi:hypothetical protein
MQGNTTKLSSASVILKKPPAVPRGIHWALLIKYFNKRSFLPSTDCAGYVVYKHPACIFINGFLRLASWGGWVF